MTHPPLKTFIIYSSRDRELRDELLQHLRPLARAHKVRVWSDAEIPPGEAWNAEIQEKLNETELFILLISKHFFNSEYIETIELPFAEQQRKAGKGFVIPILLSPCGYKHDPVVGQLEVIPKDKPIVAKDWESTDLAWEHVIDKISGRAEQILSDQNFLKIRGVVAAEKELLKQQEAAQLTEKQRLEREKAEAAEQKRKQEEAERARREAEAAERKRKEQEAAQLAEKQRLERERAEAERQKTQPEMIAVKGGTFKMGDKVQVTLSDFEIGKYPVTQKLWTEIMGDNPSHFKGDDLPVEKVSWDDCQGFLKKLNARFPGKNYRLPTEAEWEFAARGGTLSKGYEYAGSNDLNEVGWFWENSGDKPLSGEWKSELLTQNNCRTHPVGQKKANELGLHDMSGNVWEWCQDWYGDYPSGPQTNPKGPDSGDDRVLRGGSWRRSARLCRVSCRFDYSPAYRDNALGFRLVRQ